MGEKKRVIERMRVLICKTIWGAGRFNSDLFLIKFSTARGMRLLLVCYTDIVVCGSYTSPCQRFIRLLTGQDRKVQVG